MPNSKDDLQRGMLARSILTICAERYGGIEAMAAQLGVETHDVLAWLSGNSVPPVEFVRKAIEPFLPTLQ